MREAGQRVPDIAKKLGVSISAVYRATSPEARRKNIANCMHRYRRITLDDGRREGSGPRGEYGEILSFVG